MAGETPVFPDEQIDDIHKHTVPYVYREYPKHLHHPTVIGRFVVVRDQVEEKEAVKKGWQPRPVVEVTPKAIEQASAATGIPDVRDDKDKGTSK